MFSISVDCYAIVLEINAQSIIIIMDSSWVFLMHLISDMTKKFLGNYQEITGVFPYSLE